MPIEDDAIQEFRTEGLEMLGSLEESLLALEGAPGNQSAIHSAFRAMHSLKGASGFLQRADIERVTHTAEGLLDLFRKGVASPDGPAISVLLRAGDLCKRLLVEGQDPANDPEVVQMAGALAADISRLRSPASAPSPSKGPSRDEVLARRRDRMAAAKAASPLPDSAVPDAPAPAIASSATPAPSASAQPGGERPALDDLIAIRRRRMAEAVAPGGVTAPGPGSASSGQAPASPGTALAPDSSPAETSIRVDVDVLDALMNVVGELVVARNRLCQALVGADPEWVEAAAHIDHLTSELQARAMKTRMRPISAAWSSIPRTIREVCRATGREARLEMSGQETELDRSLLEAIKQPLSHIIRNALDHGVELPDDRVAVGKSREGTIHLRARYGGGGVVIEVSDDGKGIDPAVLRRKAVSSGRMGQAEADAMRDDEVVALIFEPGFSTAKEVTTTSGRGVGMDVVRMRIQGVGGRVEIHSTVGKGTTIRMRLPLTLAIVPALVVSVGGRPYCVPQASVVEIADLRGGNDLARVEALGSAWFYRLRSDLLPVMSVACTLGLAAPDSRPKGYGIVVENDGARFVLVVDDILRSEEIVVKPVGSEIKRIGVYAGATVRGDGAATLILDAVALARRADLHGAIASVQVATVDEGKPTTVLRFEATGVGFALLPVEIVRRVVDAPQIQVFSQAGQRVVNVGGHALALVQLGTELGAVILCEVDGVPVALGVADVHDVRTGHFETTAGVGPSWSVGSAFVDGELAAVVDVRRILDPRTAP